MTTNNPKPNGSPVHSNPTRRNRIARAPYNFVPLPEKVVLVEEKLPGHDRYEKNAYTGWFDCELETCSPTYVRGMVTLEHLEKVRKLLEQHECDDESELPMHEQIKLKEERARFYSAKPDSEVEGFPVPMIPGSSLRGLIRSLVEIVGYGKMRWVNDSQKVTFRAVAASREDPLAEPYRSVIGQFSRNVLAGYLKKKDDGGWEIQPALKPKDLDLPERAAYLKVKEARIPSGAIKDFVRFNDKDYWPEWYPVSFSASTGRGRMGPYVRVEQIGDPEAGFPHTGTMVCTGSMIESLDEDRMSRRRNQVLESPRRNHALVLDEDPKARPLRIDDQLLRDYQESMSPFQRDQLWQRGGLKDNAPVFYVLKNGKVAWFGHTPNFRIPAFNKKGFPVTPVDFIPDKIRSNKKPDLAEAIFGWVKEEGNLEEQRAGRVFFSDAEFVKAKDENGVWYRSEPLAPATLGSPKITTFQHYLVQDKKARHDPDVRPTLAHYGSDSDETRIRGHKLYWHKGKVSISEATSDQNEKQRTRIIPVNPGVRFKFRMHFENLRDYELGALAWALQLPGEPGKTYRHKLGMGKPLGMGAVAITASLNLTERRDKQAGRYARLLADGRLATGANADDPYRFISIFEGFILKEIASDKSRLAEVPRIRMLLAMLQWREGTDDWLDKTRYMSIQHPQNGNEYKERPVLPDPLFVGGRPSNEPIAEQRLKPSPSRSTQPASSDEPIAEQRLGTVAYIKPGRQFGYIKPDVPRNSEESNGIFFHFSWLQDGLRFVHKGDRVRFKVRNGQQGPEAHEISLEK